MPNTFKKYKLVQQFVHSLSAQRIDLANRAA
jgi:hypothetical protein